MSVAPGTKLGQYEVQDFIGQGAMGVVYRAYHADLERTGAVKVMQAITPDADTVARFRHEAQAIARMRHPNIVEVYDFGEFQGTPYMIVEYVPGGSLATRMAHGRLNRSIALKYLRGIAEGLDYAHQHGVVHRDVKPANVLLTSEDEPVLADFGLAKLLQGSSLKSMTGVTTGTPAYMAPEQVAGREVGPAADRYSLATIAYEMLTGVIPFDGEALMELLYAQVHREPLHPSQRYPDLGPEVDAVIMRGLAKDPAARWGSCVAFVDALESALVVPAPSGSTMVMDPYGRAATLPATKPASRKRSAAKSRPATVAVPVPSPDGPLASTVPVVAPAPAAAPSLPRLGRRPLIGIAAVLVLLIALGVCAVAAQATTLAVNPARVGKGGTVHVTASRVPANQAGQIELHSVVHTYPFRADSKGDVSTDITVPYDIDTGMHTVSICWSNTCHKDAALRVVAGVALSDPPASSSPSAGVSTSPSGHATPVATPSQSTGGSTPRPSSQPTARPTTQPTTPPPSPTPTADPCPPNSSALALSPQSQSVVGGGQANFSGSNFTPNSSVTLNYRQGTSSTWTPLPGVKASCAGGISVSVKVPAGLVRTDHVAVCDVKKGCITETINVVL